MHSSRVRSEARGSNGQPSRPQARTNPANRARLLRLTRRQPPAAILSAVAMVTNSTVGARLTAIDADQAPDAAASRVRQRNCARAGSRARRHRQLASNGQPTALNTITAHSGQPTPRSARTDAIG